MISQERQDKMTTKLLPEDKIDKVAELQLQLAILNGEQWAIREHFKRKADQELTGALNNGEQIPWKVEIVRSSLGGISRSSKEGDR